MAARRPKRPPGRPPGTPEGRETPRERYHKALAERVERENRVRAGELLEESDVRREWMKVIIEIREAILNATPTAVQQGIVARDQEAAHQALMDSILRRGRPEPKYGGPHAK